jgi:hypothetical protein
MVLSVLTISSYPFFRRGEGLRPTLYLTRASMSGYEGGMHLLYGVSLLCQVAILWVLSWRT